MTGPFSLDHVFNPAPGWYAGDFHAHTHHSDGVHPPDELLALAQREGLQFLSVTDHNTIAALDAFAAAPSLPVIRGLEITLKIGHFNVFGVDAWPAWLDDMLTDPQRHRQEGDWQDANALLDCCRAEGWLISLNHPLLPPWDWKHAGTLLAYVDALEVWNDPTWPDNNWANPAAVDYWTRLLNEGYRITALGGTDYHAPAAETGDYKPRLSLPRTHVYARKLSAAAILEGVRQRRASVSMGELRLDLTAIAAGRSYGMGAVMGALDTTVAFIATVHGEASAGQVHLIKNGQVSGELPLQPGRRRYGWQGRLRAEEMTWFRCDLRDEQGRYLALTNPIFNGPTLAPARQRFGDFLA